MDQDGTGTAAPLLGELLPVELMNTIWADREGVHDALATPEEALGWFRTIRERLGAQPPAVATWLHMPQPDGLVTATEQVRAVRDALRRLAADAVGDPRPVAASGSPDRASALRVLEAACAAAPTWSSLIWVDGEAPRRELHTGATPSQAVVAALAEQGVDLFAGDDGGGLRACLAPGCVLYFLKQHPRREWCSAGCGNRARVARHYQRHRVPGRG